MLSVLRELCEEQSSYLKGIQEELAKRNPLFEGMTLDFLDPPLIMSNTAPVKAVDIYLWYLKSSLHTFNSALVQLLECSEVTTLGKIELEGPTFMWLMEIVVKDYLHCTVNLPYLSYLDTLRRLPLIYSNSATLVRNLTDIHAWFLALGGTSEQNT